MSNHLLVTNPPGGGRRGEEERKDVFLCYHEMMKDAEDVSCRQICRSSRPIDEEAVDGRWGGGKSGNERVVWRLSPTDASVSTDDGDAPSPMMRLHIGEKDGS